jgi:ribosome maturation factor RimP
MTAQLLEKVREIVVPATEAVAYEVVEVEWKREQGSWILRIFIDNPQGGRISHDDCERVSRQVSAALDVSDVIPHHYSLEVSSPGLDRPLRTPEHFRRFIGQKARVRLRLGVEGRRNFSGEIVSVSDEGKAVTLSVDGKEWVLPLADLDRANLEYQFS